MNALPLRVPSYAALVSAVREQTGYPIRLSEEEAIGYDSEVRIGRASRPFHEVAYVPRYRDHALHFLVSRCLKALRLWDVPTEERYVPATEIGRHFPQNDHGELQRKLRGYLADVTEDLSRFLFAGITRQLTSMPGDIRVEREVAEHIPEHRSAQRSYLNRQVQDLEPTFLPELAEVSPEHLYAASSAMNVVLAEQAGEIAGVTPGERCRRTPYRALGQKLRKQLHATTEAGLAGDHLLTDA